ncbi:MAG: SIR2 family protein [Bryobacterales bacterium]|nr:SIR2 family protein [Bryobacterales bacterium]
MNRLEERLQRTFIPHMKTQFRRGLPILFTGAGFSLEARNFRGSTLPTVGDVQTRLWDLCFPNEPFDGSSLQDIYHHAQTRHPVEMENLLISILSVDPNSLPDWYREIHSLSWHKCYTLNIDDLADACNSAFSLPRSLRPTSFVDQRTQIEVPNSQLEVVHLNGRLEDLPNDVTFSSTQYAERLARLDPYYLDFASDLVSRSVIIIGTRLDEPPLWQHIEYRKARGGRGLRELRPRSYLVTPSLPLARKALLTELNIAWIPMTGEQFTSQVLGQVREDSIEGLKIFIDFKPKRTRSIPVVGDLAIRPNDPSEFLLGQEPIWSDLQSGRAVRRTVDQALWTLIESKLNAKSGGFVLLTGTAGSGKSTSLMRSCLRLQGQGTPVAWVDRDSFPAVREIRLAMRGHDSPPVLAIDDADMYGSSLSSLIQSIIGIDSKKVILIAIRSSKIDSTLSPAILSDSSMNELVMPNLSDPDIDGLIQVLDENNRLGFLKGKTLKKQREQFKRFADRQLLVAMIQATSNRRFEEKVVDELSDFGPDKARVYALISVAHSFRFGLRKDEVLIAYGEMNNNVLNLVEELVNRKIIIRHQNGLLWSRHRVIADTIHNSLQESGQIKSVLEGLVHVAASKIRPTMSASDRPRRMLRLLLNHDYLLRVVGLDSTRNLYVCHERVLHWDYHYWLQRGSAEVEEGQLPLAEHFLNQARSISPGDPLVRNEWAYYLLRKAIDNPMARNARQTVNEATGILESLMAMSHRVSSYPYHVLGSQGLAWSRRGLGTQEKGPYLHSLLQMLEDGVRKYPTARDLLQLRDDLKREYLQIAIPKRIG